MGIWNGIELADLTLRSARLTLRPWSRGDADRVLEAASTDPWMREFLPIPDPYTAADAEYWVTSLGHEGRYEGTGFGAALVESATGQLVGGAAIRLPGPASDRQDVGYSVYPWARGHGYAAEAAATLADWAFSSGLHRLEIRCSVRNIASVKSALAAGFRHESTRRDAIETRSSLDDDAIFVRLASDPGTPIAPVLAALPSGGLSDGVVSLRVSTPADAQAMLEESNDSLTRSWEFDDDLMTAEDARRRAATSAMLWLAGPVGRMTLIDVASGEYAGSMQLRQAGPPAVCEIGYAVHPSFRGRGYTSRGLRLLSAWAFSDGGIERLELGAKAANLASQKSALNAGFESDGVVRSRLRNVDGTFSDEARFFRCR